MVNNTWSIQLNCHKWKTHFGLSSSWMSFSFSLKQPNEQMAFSTSGSTEAADGRTCVCTTSIMGSSSSSSPLPPAVTHWCRLISDSVIRLSGFTSIMPRNRLWQSGGTKCGMWKTPRLTFSSSCRKLSSSNGKAPTSNAYRMTPHDHTSARRPSYFSPCVMRMIWNYFIFLSFTINARSVFLSMRIWWRRNSSCPMASRMRDNNNNTN